MVTHGPVAVAALVVPDPDPDVVPGQEESQYPHCPVAWCDPYMLMAVAHQACKYATGKCLLQTEP